MLQFLHPVTLISLTALTIPVLVHLWHTRKGKTVKIGSIRLFTINSKQKASSRRIHNWPLFITRCLLLGALSLLIATPLWIRPAGVTTDIGWIIADPLSMKLYRAQHPLLVDSLLRQGYSLHLPLPGFPATTMEDSNQAVAIGHLTAWESIRELEGSLPPGFPVILISGDRLSDFTGDRPSSALNLTVHLTPSSDTDMISTETFFTDKGKIRSLIRTGNRDGIRYQSGDSLMTQATKPDTATTRLVIYQGKNNDGDYILAAARALELYTGRKIITEQVPEGSIATIPADLVFIPDTTSNIDSRLTSVKDHGSLLVYAGDPRPVPQTLMNTGGTALDKSDPVYISMMSSGTTAGKKIWTTADGYGILTMQLQGNKKIYRLGTGLNPASTSLVWDEQFVKAILPLILPVKNPQPADPRRIDSTQALPGQLPPNTGSRITRETLLKPSGTDLSHIVWLVALLLFAVERVLAHKKNLIKN